MRALIIKAIISLLFSAVIGFGFYELIATTEYIWYAVAGTSVAIFVGSIVTAEFKLRKPSTLLFPLLALLLGVGVGLNLFIAFGPLLKYVFIGVNCIIFAALFTFFSHKYKQDDLHPGTQSTLIDDMGEFLQLYILFLGARGILGVFSFTHEYLWIFLLGLAGFVMLQGVIFFWQHELLNVRSLFYVVLAALMMTELAWIVTLWPISYSSAAMLITSAGYLFFGMCALQQKGALTPRAARMQVAFTLALVILILATSKWTPV